ncbi:MAG: phosphodiester glycosidase family protein [Bacteroidales bacterium]|nr:phosphodiester glycosidase family protein [Bacteroidales bacterium]
MKKSLTIFLSIVCSLGLCLAQSPKDAISQDPLKAAGTFYVYDSSALGELTPAPDGYEPFYISHFARHGARYCTSEYEYLYGWLSKAAEKELLTEEGKAFFARYGPFYQKVRYSKGNLTDLGKSQHRAIAQHMFQRFPAVFEGPTHVESVSTESPRVIMSMWSFLSEIQSLDKDMDVHADASARFAPWLQPSLSSNPYLLKGSWNCGKAADDAAMAYFNNTVPCKDIVTRFFTKADVPKKTLRITPERFVTILYEVCSSTHCLDTDQGCFDDVFSADEAFSIWKALSARYFHELANFTLSESLALDYSSFTVEQIIASADEDIASGNTQLRLRFGHDSGISALEVFLDLNGFGHPTASLEESLEIFPDYNIPMGASLQLVFYRNADGNVLVKALVNEQEATLPLRPVMGPYYSWNDFKAHYLPLIEASKRKISESEPLYVLKNVNWGWKSVAGSSVESAAASVKVFGSTQSISLVRFPIREHTVSVVESHGPDAMITSRFGQESGALAAINGSYFDKEVMPVTFVKDEGRVLSTSTGDGFTRSNGMFRIKDKKGRKVDILTIEENTIGKSARLWREAIVSGPVLIEEGKVVPYEDDGSRSYRKFYNYRHPRTLMGYTADGWIYFMVVDGRFPGQADGMTIFELQTLCKALGLWEAINLDGGGSSTLWTRDGGVLNHPYDNKLFDHAGERTVPNALIVR